TSSGARALVLYFYGDPCNSATADDQLWVQLEDTNSNSGLALYDDVNDLALPSWAEWNIDLDIFDACGVSLANVDKISIGFAGETVGGDCKGGGIGTVWFDDIRLYPPRCVPEYGPEADLTGDCGVDFKDFGVVGEDWLKCNKLPDPNGFVEEWVARYDGPGNSDDGATAIAVDDSNNVYVTGYSIGDGTGGDYATIRYGPDSNETIWVARYNGPTNDGDVASAIAVDDSNNVYVTGQSDGGATGYDYATIKYDPADGNELWSARYNGPGNGSDEGWDIAVDDSNNVYVTGGSYGDGTGDDYATIKYDPVDGNELWVARYNGPGNGGDVALAIAVDDSNNVYVTGRSWGNGTDHDYATIKYDPADGNELWVARYNGPGNSSDEGWDIAVDDSGFVYVTGRSNGTGDDYATIKYDPADGNELWVARYNGPGNGQDEAQAIAVDDSNNVYVTGGSYGSGTDHDYATIKYDLADGNELWVARYNGPGNDIDVAHAIAVDDSNNVYVTGVSYGDSTDEDYATIKYDPNGNQLWLDRYNGPVNGIDYATGIAIDDMGNVYVTGESGYMSPESHYATIKYSQVSCTPPLDGDLNNDCKVDFQDLAIVVDNWLEEFLWPEP
ncbi:MAG: SBBP repeat-containing protein, partial [Planctomycetota bacterium]